MGTHRYTIDSTFKLKCLLWASTFDHYAFLNYNGLPYHYGAFPSLLAVGTSQSFADSIAPFESLKSFASQKWLFGYFGYDLKNHLEKLKSQNEDKINFPDQYFFQPIHLFRFLENEVELSTEGDGKKIIEQINAWDPEISFQAGIKHTIHQKVSKEQYKKNIEEIKNHLLEGNIYELNYCMEFYAENIVLDPVHLFLKLNALSPMPFSIMMRIKENYILSASPERFLKKEKNQLISQPIKGTSKRGKTQEEDTELKNALLTSEKERSENMMIVDLVRNDLARSSKPGSVKVEELFGIYTFPNVHQMISTIRAEIRDDIHFIDAIKNAFPMGSMTGAPKISAMELIEKFESSKRGVFSGAAGYITPDGDFDFNVVIRSILYSGEKKCLSFQVGSAITFDSDPEKEYEECLLKAEAMRKVLED